MNKSGTAILHGFRQAAKIASPFLGAEIFSSDFIPNPAGLLEASPSLEPTGNSHGSAQGRGRNFKQTKDREVEEARQTAGFFLMCGIDLSAALASSGAVRGGIVKRLKRLIERERLKGARRHWSYDLNRHIALK